MLLPRHYYREMQQISFRKDILPMKDQLFRLALRITLNRAEAEDIVQDALIKVWNKRDEWKQWESIEAYCFTVTRNLSIDRMQKKENQTVELSPAEEETMDYTNPHESMVNNEQLALVYEMMNRLPEKQSTVMHLRDIEGKSYKAIAALMGLTEEQVKINLFRARQKVKQWFTKIDKYGL